MTVSITATTDHNPHIEKSRGLPRSYYFSRDMWMHEQSTLWADTWQLVCRESELARPGDYVTYKAGDQPLLVIRSDDGALRALHNVCPHRGARILDERGNCAVVQCRYHGWSFERDGRLRGLPQPQFFSGVDRAQLSLAPARVDTWGGFVFVNAAAQGESLREYLAGFPEFLEQYEHSWHALEEVDRWVYEEPANWKFSVENYRECYHLPVVHARSLECFVPGQIRYTPTGRHYQIFVPYADDDAVRSHPSFPGEPRGVSYQGHLFPNVMFNTAKDMVSMFRLAPLSPETVAFEVTIYQTADQRAQYPHPKDAFKAELDEVLMEDFLAVRRLQEGVRSAAYRVNLADTLEYGISHFHSVLAGYYPDLHADGSRD